VTLFSIANADVVFDCGLQTEEDCLRELLCQAGNVDETSKNCLATGLDRSVAIAPTKDYGCYCRDRADISTGKGLPVDEFDRVCRKRQKRLSCLQMDIDAGVYQEPECQGVRIENLSFVDALQFVSVPGSQDPGIGCGTNATTCQVDLCNIEIGSITEEQEAQVEGYYNGSMQFVNGFDASSGCFPAGNAIGIVDFDSCCGTHPDRYPYSSAGNGLVGGSYPPKECCVASGKIFIPGIMQCCPDGSIKAVC